jgi:hypothetical protein
VNDLPFSQNLHEAESALFSSWYFPASQSTHAVVTAVKALPSAQVLHSTEGALFSS